VRRCDRCVNSQLLYFFSLFFLSPIIERQKLSKRFLSLVNHRAISRWLFDLMYDRSRLIMSFVWATKKNHEYKSVSGTFLTRAPKPAKPHDIDCCRLMRECLTGASETSFLHRVLLFVLHADPDCGTAGSTKLTYSQQ